MSDVFISYARSTEREARAVADALRALGYGVWRDDELPAHRAFSDVIEERLMAAKAVVVIWSAEAAKSEWVQSEADRARVGRKLVQLSIDGAPRPMPFDRIQCADLAGWGGDLGAPGWRKVAASIAELMGAPPAPAPAVSSHAWTAVEPLLAVLAFDNLSGDPEMAYFSDGISQEILDTVAQGSDVKVIARGSSFQLRGPEKTARKVAAALRATHLLDGAVRRAGSRVRISAQLVECATETSLWANRFDRELEDIFALQDEIAAAVAEALKKAFAPSVAPVPIDPVGYEGFLKTLALHNKGGTRTQAGASRGIRLLEEVVASAPEFARAWELLSVLRATALRFGWLPGDFAVGRALALEAIERTLALDPSRGGAYMALVELEPWGAFRAREGLVLKALAASPGDAGILADAARVYTSVGRRRESLRYSNEARALDPLLPLAQFWFASSLVATGRTEEGLAIFETLQANSADTVLAGALLAWVAGLGRWDLFDRWRETGLASGGDNPSDLGPILAHAERLRHRDPAAIVAFIETCRAEIAATGTISLNHVVYLDMYGETEVLFELIEAASFAHMFRADGPPPSGSNTVSVIFVPLAKGGMLRDPRFVRLCAKLGLVRYWLDTGAWPDCADRVRYDFRAEALKTDAEGLAAR